MVDVVDLGPGDGLLTKMDLSTKELESIKRGMFLDEVILPTTHIYISCIRIYMTTHVYKIYLLEY